MLHDIHLIPHSHVQYNTTTTMHSACTFEPLTKKSTTQKNYKKDTCKKAYMKLQDLMWKNRFLGIIAHIQQNDK
jgi:hypothetical protein